MASMKIVFSSLPLRLRRMTLRMALGAVLCPGLATADPRDHDTARQAVERGEIKPLADILTVVRNKLPAKLWGSRSSRRRAAVLRASCGGWQGTLSRCTSTQKRCD